MNRFDNIPSSACRLSLGKFQLSADTETKEGSKFPIHMLARSNKAVSHGFWGNVVHDFGGMKLGKDHVTIDYCHNPAEVLGYLDKYEITADGLEMDGVLIPFKPDDRASEVICKNRAGVNYEASINFAGDGLVVEVVDDGQFAQVNNEQIMGPMTIIREWPLRGVAVIAYGADGNTSTAFGVDGKTYKATELTNKDIDMNKKLEAEKPVETVVPAAVETPVVPPVEPVKVEDKPAEVPAAEKPVEEVVVLSDVENAKLATFAQFTQLADSYGYEFAKAHFGQAPTDIMAAVVAMKDKQIAELSAKIPASATSFGAAPVAFNPPPAKKLSYQDMIKFK